MCSHRTLPFGLLRVDTEGYFVTRVPDDVVYPVCYCEFPTELPLQLLGSPRSCSMMLLVRSRWSDTTMPRFLDTQFFHSHSTEYTCHLRLVLAIPEEFSQLDAVRPCMMLNLSGVRINRPLAMWTSFVCVAAELDIDSDNVDVLLGAYQFMDRMIHHRLNSHMEWLLDGPPSELAPATDRCVTLLERSAMSSYTTFRRFVHQFHFLTFVPGTDELVRMTSADFRACCRLHHCDLHFSVFDQGTTDMPSVPCVVLAQPQVPHVRAAVLAAYGVSLRSCEGGARGAKGRSEVLIRVAQRIAAPVVCECLSDQVLAHLLRHDKKLVSSVSRGANTRQVREAVAACRRAGLVDSAALLVAGPHPTSLVADPIALSRAADGQLAGGASPPLVHNVSTCAPGTVPSAAVRGVPRHTPTEHAALWSAISTLQLEVRTLVLWAGQFEDDGNGPPGTIVRSIDHFQYEEKLQQVHDGLGLCKEDILQTTEALRVRIQRLTANHNKLEGQLLAHQQRAEQILNTLRLESAKLEASSQACSAEIQRARDLLGPATTPLGEPALSDVQTSHQSIIAKVAALSGQVELCMRLCRRTLMGSPVARAAVPPQGVDAKFAQTFELLRVHTVAISRTWQWTSSLVHAVSKLSVPTRNNSLPAAVPPPPPVPPPPAGLPPQSGDADSAGLQQCFESPPVVLPCVDTPCVDAPAFDSTADTLQAALSFIQNAAASSEVAAEVEVPAVQVLSDDSD
eukprot:1019277-Amphidinium_carterae.4